MADEMAPNSIGSASVEIVGDYSGLQTELQQAQQYAQQAGDAIAHALDHPDAASHLTDSVHGAGEAAHEAEGHFAELALEIGKMAGITLSFEGIKELATDALEAYSQVQRATIALTALSGSAGKANEEIEGLKALAQEEAISFPSLVTANQRLTAFGIEAESIPGVLRAAADAAAATNNSFDQAANAIERIALSGNTSAKALMALGLSTHDLAQAIGVDTSELKQHFADMDPTERVNAIVTALQKYKDVGHEVADSLSGEWQRMQTAADFSLEEIGKAIAPTAEALMGLANDVLPQATKAVEDLVEPASSLGETLIAFKDAAKSAVDSSGELHDVLVVVEDAAHKTGMSFSDVLLPGVKEAAQLFKGLTLALQAYTNTGPQIDQMNKAVADSLTKLKGTANETSEAFQKAFNASLVENGLEPIVQGTQRVVDAETKQTSAVNQASEALAQLNRHYQEGKPLVDGTVVTTQMLADAQKALRDAYDASTKSVQNYAETVGGLSRAYDDQHSKIQTLTATVTQLANAQDGSQKMADLLAEAQKKLNAALFDSEKAHEAVTVAAQGQGKAYEGLVKTADELLQKEVQKTIAVGEAKAVLDQLTQSTDTSAEHTRAVADATKQWVDAMKASGVSMTDQIQIEQNGVTVITTLGGLVEQLKNSNNTLNTSVQNGVTVLTEHSNATQKATGSVQEMGVQASNASSIMEGLAAHTEQCGEAAAKAEAQFLAFGDGVSSASSEAENAFMAFGEVADQVGRKAVNAMELWATAVAYAKSAMATTTPQEGTTNGNDLTHQLALAQALEMTQKAYPDAYIDAFGNIVIPELNRASSGGSGGGSRSGGSSAAGSGGSSGSGLTFVAQSTGIAASGGSSGISAGGFLTPNDTISTAQISLSNLSDSIATVANTSVAAASTIQAAMGLTSSLVVATGSTVASTMQTLGAFGLVRQAGEIATPSFSPSTGPSGASALLGSAIGGGSTAPVTINIHNPVVTSQQQAYDMMSQAVTLLRNQAGAKL